MAKIIFLGVVVLWVIGASGLYVYNARKVKTANQSQKTEQTKFEKAISENELNATAAELIEKIKERALPAALADLTEFAPTVPSESRVGGPVYLPKNIPYPFDEARKPLLFLAQINFSEVPPLPEFPKTGIIQVFVRADEELGSFGNKEKNWKIFYWPEAVELSQKHDAISMPMIELASALIYKNAYPDPSKSEALDIHINGRCLRFRPSTESHLPGLIWEHFEIQHIDGQYSYLDENDIYKISNLIDEKIHELNERAPIRIGGYPSIPQNPPELSSKTNLDYTKILSRDEAHARTLLHIDSINPIQIWDNDSINIVITKTNLETTKIEETEYFVAQ